MEKFMKTKRIFSIVLCLILIVCTAGCGDKKESDVPQPDMAMKTVRQNSLEDYVTFEFQLPEGWISGPVESNELAAIAGAESEVGKPLGIMEQLPYRVDISNYYYSYFLSGKTIPDEIKQMYLDLFSGNPDSYQAKLNEPPSYLSDQRSDEYDSITDFQYKLYQGKNGKIAEIQYQYKIQGKEYHTIECYCENPTYKVSGTFDESLKLSSGDLALWVADSLKVDEHFSLKNGKIEKKD